MNRIAALLFPGLIFFINVHALQSAGHIAYLNQTELNASKFGDTVITEKEIVCVLRKQILEEAQWAMQQQAVTITSFPALRSAGGIHDFYSEGDYWWPDPQHADSPYIRKDGITNPENFTSHRQLMIRFSRIVGALASAYKITGKKEYAHHALRHCKAWLDDTATRMNPSLLYAQAIKGRVTGRGIGIIDAVHLMEVVKGIETLQCAGIIKPDLYQGFQRWFADYLKWVTTHPYGIEEREAKNNHGTCWVMQVAVFARLTNDTKLMEYCRERYKTVLLPGQMDSDGSFPLELQRTKPYGYSLFNLDAMATICQTLSTKEDDLWNFRLRNGRSIKKGIEFLYPYIENKDKWPFKKDVMYWDDWPVAQPALLFGARELNHTKWFVTWKRLDHAPAGDEIIRNLPVRYPLLWL